MFCSLRSSLWAIFCASALKRALFKDSRSADMSSSSSSASSPSSPGSPSAPATSPERLPLSFRISRCSSFNCLRSTVSRSSSFVRLCILELISLDSFCTSTTLLTKSRISCRRFLTLTVSNTCWRSAMESCESPAAIMSTSTEAEAGQRTPPRLLLLNRLLNEPPALPPPCPCADASLSNSTTSCCTPCISSFTSGSPETASSFCSSSNLTVAT
mmetsp:Transcript_440/g.1048  ORF Transcript_440/g.1048 Transcript_440/m.1048 type:complete len:214 (+) Transcript_440:2077-2718(+)